MTLVKDLGLKDLSPETVKMFLYEKMTGETNGLMKTYKDMIAEKTELEKQIEDIKKEAKDKMEEVAKMAIDHIDERWKK